MRYGASSPRLDPSAAFLKIISQNIYKSCLKTLQELVDINTLTCPNLKFI